MQLPRPLRKIEIKSFLFLLSVTVLSYLFIVAIRDNKLKLGNTLGQWMWYYYPRNVNHKLWFPYSVFLVFLLYIFLLKGLLKRPGLTRVKELLLLCGLVLVVFSLNISVFSLSMFGLDELLQIIIHSGRTSFFTDAVKIQDVSLFLQNYSVEIKNLTHHSQVHGPGAILLFSFIYKMFGLLPGSEAVLTCLSRFLHLNVSYTRDLLISSGMPGNSAALLTSLFMGLFFPFTVSLTVLPLYYSGKILYGRETAIIACGVFALVPPISLFTPQLAQMLTMLGVLSTWLLLQAARDKRRFLAVLAGLTFAVSLFFGLELLVLIPVWVAVIFFAKYSCNGDSTDRVVKKNMKSEYAVRTVLIFLGTVVIFFVLLFLLFRFNVVESYRNSMEIHNILEIRRPYSKWIWANFLEYFVFMGVPVTILFFQKLVRQFKGIRTRRVDVFFLSFVFTLVALDLSGVNRGEVARLWMFLLPFMALFVASEIRSFGVTISPGFLLVAFLIILSLGFSYTVGLKSMLLTLPLTLALP